MSGNPIIEPARKGEIDMCTFCGGSLAKSTTEYIEKQGNFIIVVQNVPCDKCTQCGESYFTTATVERLEAILKSVQIVTGALAVMVLDYAGNAA